MGAKFDGAALVHLPFKGIIVLVQPQLTQHLVLDHHRLVVLIQNGLKLRAVLMGLDLLDPRPQCRQEAAGRL